MDEHSLDRLQVLGQLALEYQKKYKELEEVVRSAQREEIIQQLGYRAEMTTDHFRGAQQALFAFLSPSQESESQEAFRALTTLCRCFDEMRILLQIILEHASKFEAQTT